jgi:hypothetical protein
MAEHTSSDISSSNITKALTIIEQLQPTAIQDASLASPTVDPVAAMNASKADQVSTTEVFGINELFGLILERVPVQNRSQLRRVSKTWNSIVIYIGHIIDPVDAEPFEVRHKSIEIGDLIWIDEDEHCYEADFNILMNPGLENDLYPSFWLFDNAQMGAFELPSDVSSLLTKREEFVTTPPITTLMLALASVEFDVCVDDEHWGHATLRVRTGIRVGDLLDMFSKIGGRTYQYWEPVAYFCLRGPGTITSLKEEYASEFAVDMGADNGKQLRDDEQIEKDPGEGCGDEADDNEHTVSHTSEQQDAS